MAHFVHPGLTYFGLTALIGICPYMHTGYSVQKYKKNTFQIQDTIVLSSFAVVILVSSEQ